MQIDSKFEWNVKSYFLEKIRKIFCKTTSTEIFTNMLNIKVKKNYLSVFDNIIKELSSGNMFHYHKDICWCTDNLISGKKFAQICIRQLSGDKSG